jgi:hypothetical protein
MKTNILNLTLAALLISPVFANASTFTGNPQVVRINTGTSQARVSIFVGPHGSPCGTANWFAYENADTPGTKQALWTTGLLAAVQATPKRNVTIAGSGVCDSFGVEGLTDIDFN